MSAHRYRQSLPIAERRVLRDQLWDRLLGPPRQEPTAPEHIATPEELGDAPPRSRGESKRR
jgi:hypothetical protein